MRQERVTPLSIYMSNPYEVMAELSAECANLSVRDQRDYLWRNVPRLDQTIRAELARFAEGAYLEQVSVYVEDAFMSQGNSLLQLDYRFAMEDPFTVRLTCVVGHPSISVRVSRPPVDARFDRVRLLFEPPYSTEPYSVKHERQLRELMAPPTSF